MVNITYRTFALSRSLVHPLILALPHLELPIGRLSVEEVGDLAVVIGVGVNRGHDSNLGARRSVLADGQVGRRVHEHRVVVVLVDYLHEERVE